MSGNALRGPMAPVARRVRAYFAPVNRDSGEAAVFDPSRQGAFALDSPPAPWIDLGWVENFRRTAGTHVEVLRAGVKGAPGGQFRSRMEARV